MDPSRLTASVVGGGTGGRLSLKALAASEHFELVAVADLREDVRRDLEQTFPGIKSFPDHQSMFRECSTDVTCVSTYPPSHESVTVDALSMLSLKGILVEKPLGHTVASGRRILDAIKARGLPLAVPHGLVAKRTPAEIIERVQQGEIGELRLVEIQCRGWDIINAGIHWLHFFVTLTRNTPMDFVMALCDASTRTYRDGMQVETAAITYAQTKSGVRVAMHTGDDVLINEPGQSTLFRLIGSAGMIEFFGWDAPYRLRNVAHPDGKTITPQEWPTIGHRRHLDNMARQIDANLPDYAVADASLSALELCEGAYLSSRYGCRVTFPIDAFERPAPSDWQPGEPYGGSGGGRDGRKL